MPRCLKSVQERVSRVWKSEAVELHKKWLIATWWDAARRAAAHALDAGRTAAGRELPSRSGDQGATVARVACAQRVGSNVLTGYLYTRRNASRGVGYGSNLSEESTVPNNVISFRPMRVFASALCLACAAAPPALSQGTSPNKPFFSRLQLVASATRYAAGPGTGTLAVTSLTIADFNSTTTQLYIFAPILDQKTGLFNALN